MIVRRQISPSVTYEKSKSDPEAERGALRICSACVHVRTLAAAQCFDCEKRETGSHRKENARKALLATAAGSTILYSAYAVFTFQRVQVNR